MKHGEWVDGTQTSASWWLGPDSHRAWKVCIDAKFWGACRFPEDFNGVYWGNDNYPVAAARKIWPDFDKISALSDEELEALRTMCANNTKEWVLFTAALIEHEIRDKLVTRRRQSDTGEM